MSTPQASSLNAILSALSNHAYNSGLPDSTVNQLETLHAKAATALRSHGISASKGDMQGAKAHLHHAGENMQQAARLAGAGHMIPQIQATVGSFR
jgi:hypothetical protein